MSIKTKRAAGEISRQAILRAATTEFAKRGFDGTTTRDIVEAAGLSPAALYMYFSSKEELLYVLMKDGLEGLITLARLSWRG
jgi:AcrR family transcriptional regulator